MTHISRRWRRLFAGAMSMLGGNILTRSADTILTRNGDTVIARSN